jgi:hypothetical protein
MQKPNAETVLSMIDGVLIQNLTAANKVKEIEELLGAYYEEDKND